MVRAGQGPLPGARRLGPPQPVGHGAQQRPLGVRERARRVQRSGVQPSRLRLLESKLRSHGRHVRQRDGGNGLRPRRDLERPFRLELVTRRGKRRLRLVGGGEQHDLRRGAVEVDRLAVVRDVQRQPVGLRHQFVVDVLDHRDGTTMAGLVVVGMFRALLVAVIVALVVVGSKRRCGQASQQGNGSDGFQFVAVHGLPT